MTVLVALIAGALGAALAVVGRLRAERLDQLRTRRIDAADAFAAAWAEVFVALTERMQRLGASAGREAEWLAGLREAANEALENMHKVSRAAPRLELLFGPATPVAAAGMDTARHLFRMTDELRREPADPRVVEEEFERAATASGRFLAEAHRVITVPAWRQFLG